MTGIDPDEYARRLAADSLSADDVTGWFERLYSAADRGEAVVPWDRGGPHPLLVQWTRNQAGFGGRALVVGTGLGSDAELLAGLGYATTGFDVSATAIRSARDRFPESAVGYTVADLLDPPAEWRTAFDLVVESLTVQAMPDAVRGAAISNVASFVAPGGRLVVIAACRENAARVEGPPWPLSRDQIEAFATGGLRPARVELIPSPQNPAALRWLAEFYRPPDHPAETG